MVFADYLKYRGSLKRGKEYYFSRYFENKSKIVWNYISSNTNSSKNIHINVTLTTIFFSHFRSYMVWKRTIFLNYVANLFLKPCLTLTKSAVWIWKNSPVASKQYFFFIMCFGELKIRTKKKFEHSRRVFVSYFLITKGNLWKV